MGGQCIIVMGVSGSGKTTIGQALAKARGCTFVDGDDLHPQHNIQKMKAGNPLTDDDRRDWLLRINAEAMALSQAGSTVVFACSALKQRYRDILRSGLDRVLFVYLKGSFDQISQQLKQREGHFMPETLLRSQFDALEEPTHQETDCVTIPIEPSLELEMAAVAKALSQRNF